MGVFNTRRQYMLTQKYRGALWTVIAIVCASLPEFINALNKLAAAPTTLARELAGGAGQ
jgi:hypothetical protein